MSDVSTLSGRPTVVEPPAVRGRRTQVSRASAFWFTVFLVGVLVVVGLAFLGRGPEGTDVRELQPGQCYTEVDTVDDGGRTIPYGKDTPCTPASPRVLAVVHLPLGPYPGVDGLNDVVRDRCGGEQDHVIAPTAETWATGDRVLACLVIPA